MGKTNLKGLAIAAAVGAVVMFGSSHARSTPLLVVKPQSKLFGIVSIRGGASTTSSTNDQELSLDEKVQAAMAKLGLSSPSATTDTTTTTTTTSNNNDNDDSCENGVCPMPTDKQQPEQQSTTIAQELPSTSSSSTSSPPSLSSPDPFELAEKISKDLNVDSSLAMAALGATASDTGDSNNGDKVFNEQLARDMIQQELDLISQIKEDSEEVTQLVSEGFDPFFSRRALAFTDMNIENARAVLIADEADEQEEAAAAAAAAAKQQEDEEAAVRAQLRAEAKSTTAATAAPVAPAEVSIDFDPTALPTKPAARPSPVQQQQQQQPPDGMPKPAPKESVVFEATTAQIQELVLESPVPVLLDVYADWCGPCKVLGPALEEMAVKAGGVFRLVKVNSDNERPVSGALEVTALPTVYGIRDGKIVHMFQGMPRSEDFMKNFMMGLFGAAPFSPPVTADETTKYKELTSKLIKTASAASFSFSARERLHDRITTKLDELVHDDSVCDVQESAMLLRTLFANIVSNPHDKKYRRVNLENKKIAAAISGHASCITILKSVGFATKKKFSTTNNELVVGMDKKVINVAPFVTARDCIDKWIVRNRAEMAAAARKRKDELDRVQVQAELAKAAEQAAKEEAETQKKREQEEANVDPDLCSLSLRLDGKKKVHKVMLHKDEPLKTVLTSLGVEVDNDDGDDDDEVQITCVAKRLVVKSSNQSAMMKTLNDYGLFPSAAIVVSHINKKGATAAKTSDNTDTTEDGGSSSSIKERAAARKAKKKGSHTMQSIGIYAKDDNNKAELIDGGGGVWYEHDVSDDEQEETKDDNDVEEEEFKEEYDNEESE